MIARTFLPAAILLITTAASASAGTAGASAWLEGADGRASGLLRLSSARTISGGADAFHQTWTETWTLAIDPSCKLGTGDSRVIWRDERSWRPMAITVTPGVGRLFVRPEHDDVIVVLTSVEGTSRWGGVVCVDVFRVTVAEVASPTTPAAAKPLARLVQPHGENNWRLADVLVGDAGLVVDLEGDPDVRRAYQLDLKTADWHDVSIGEQVVPGIAARKTISIDPVTGEQHENRPVTTRPPSD